MAGQFAWSADSVLLEQLLWEAFLRWGVPRRLYTDQGAIYTSDRLDLICGRLDLRLVHTPPYTPQGKGYEYLIIMESRVWKAAWKVAVIEKVFS